MKPIFYGQRLGQRYVRITTNIHFAMCHDLNGSCAPKWSPFLDYYWGYTSHLSKSRHSGNKKKKQREDIHGDNWKQNSLGIIAQNNVPTIPLLDFRTSPKINISPSSPQNDCFLFSPTHYKMLKSQLLIYVHI